MTVRALDENGDIVTYGDIFISGREEIAQTCVTRLNLFLGEYFRDVTDGTPWFQQILGKFGNLNNVESLLRNRIARTPGVVRLLSFNLDYDLQKRTITVSSYVLTKFGETEVLYNGTVDSSGL
ncbi:MAG TPA: hypothetical protein ENI26_01900 [Methylophaga aminisulfidivorans]|uniref:DUF2634 domain-containing protein n=2 Tax=root TaxID=1 RepID=A0A7C1VMT1_9GAMM|nr:hypothetical protein [Methylophaga aminisulfidivorans]